MKDCGVWQVPHRKHQVHGVWVNYYNVMALYYYVLLRQDTLSNRVNNILSWDPSGQFALKKSLPPRKQTNKTKLRPTIIS